MELKDLITPETVAVAGIHCNTEMAAEVINAAAEHYAQLSADEQEIYLGELRRAAKNLKAKGLSS